jgi:hypothetical protein
MKLSILKICSVIVAAEAASLPLPRIVHPVGQPMRVSFGTIPGIEVIRRFELFGRAWQLCEHLPAHWAVA